MGSHPTCGEAGLWIDHTIMTAASFRPRRAKFGGELCRSDGRPGHARDLTTVGTGGDNTSHKTFHLIAIPHTISMNALPECETLICCLVFESDWDSSLWGACAMMRHGSRKQSFLAPPVTALHVCLTIIQSSMLYVQLRAQHSLSIRPLIKHLIILQLPLTYNSPSYSSPFPKLSNCKNSHRWSATYTSSPLST